MYNFLFVFLVVSKLINVSPFIVDGQSMDPTLVDKEVFLIEKKLPAEKALKRGDIVVFSLGDDFYYVKRVIGLPGETVRLHGQSVAIKQTDGSYRELNEPYLMNQKFDYGDKRYFIIPEGKYFVMGDNRDHSKDSRTFIDPYIGQSHIYGRYIYP